MNDYVSKEDFVGKKITAGVCAILLGSLGVHKFILGFTTSGVIMLILGICSFGSISGTIGLIEGIIYLTKSDDDFFQSYAIDKREWF